MEQITDGLKEQFAKNISLVIQQEGSKLRKCVTNGTQDTEVISFESMTTHEVESRNRYPIDPDDHLHGHYADARHPARLEQIEFKIPTISRRFLTASSYHWNATMDRNDKLNLLTDPTSHFPKMAGWAMGRQQDRVIISAFASPVRAGRTGNNVINFDVVNNVIPIGIRVTDANLTLNAQAAVAGNRGIIDSKRAGLTVDKLIKAHHILKKRSFGMYNKLYLLCSSNQISDLLRDPQITNYDYNNVRALVSGEVNSFLGFTFITSEMLGGIFDDTGDANRPRYAVKDCYAFNEGAIRFNTVSGSNKKGIEELVQYHYAKVLYYSEAFGASRDNEQAVVVIKCLENYDKGTFTKELQELAIKDPAILKQLALLSNPNSFVNQLDLMLGVKPQIPSVDRILGAYRAWKCMVNLGKVVLSSIPDMISFVSELQNNGIPLLHSYANILQVAATGFNGKKKKELGRLLGISVDSLLRHSHSRFAGEYPVSGSIFKLTNAFFKLNCMEWWDNTWKSTVGNLLSHNLALQVNKPFNLLYHNLQTLLNRYGINESNWHLYQHLVQQIENKAYLIPDMALLPDHLLEQHLQQQSGKSTISSLDITRFKQDLTNNLRRYLLDRVDTAIATPHTAEKNAVLLGNLGIKAGSPAAAVIQCIMQFKTFAYTYITRPLKSITIDQIPLHQQIGSGNLLDLGTWKDIAKSMRNPTTIKMLFQLLSGSIGLGYLSINAKRLVEGKEWIAPNEEGVFMASLLQGGGLGLFGDFFFNEYDSYNNLLKALAGTMGSDIIDFGTILTLIKNGELDKAEKLLKKSLQRNIPGRNLFYLQPALCGFHDCHSLNW